MTVRLMEGGEINGTVNSYMQRKYAFATGWGNTNAGRLHGISIQSGGASEFRTRSFGLESTWVVGFGFNTINNLLSFSTGNPEIVLRRGNDEQCRLEFEKIDNNNFNWRLMRGATEIDSAGPFSAQIWHYFELKVTVNTVTGAYELRANQTNVMSGSSVNTAETGSNDADVIDFQILQSPVRMDDIYILDTNGTINNDFLGDSTIEGRLPTGNGFSNDWTVVGGANAWQVLNDTVGAGEDSDLVETSTTTDVQLLTFDALSFITGQIHAVQLEAMCQLDAVGSRTLRFKVRSGGTTYDDASFVVNSTQFETFLGIVETDPDTAVKWTISGVDNAEFGFELVS